MVTFYKSIIESVLSQSITVWYTRACQQDINKLNSVVRNAENIIGTTLPNLEQLYISRMTKKTNNILEDKYHPARKYFEPLRSGYRFKCFKGNKRFINSCYPSAVKLFNQTSRRGCPI